MSNAPATPDRSALEEEFDRATTIARRAGRTAVRQTRAVGFWSAVTLPFLYVPVLATGLETPAETGVVLGLLVVNLLAVLLGRGHNTE